MNRETGRVKRMMRAAVFAAMLTMMIGAGQVGTLAEDKDAASGESKFAKLDNLRVHYRIAGKGDQALVFVHGWACNLEFWRAQTPRFDKKMRVILVDLPGHGKSDKPQINYTQDLFAEAINQVLIDAKINKAVLVGHSMGTPVIRQFYRRYPNKTLALVVVDGALRPYGDKSTMEQFVAPLRGPGYKEAAAGFIDMMLGPQMTPALKDEIKTSMLNTPQYVALSAFDGMLDPALWKETGEKITVPVLAILAKSPFWPPDNEQFFRSVTTNLEYHMWDGVSHFLMMEKPKEFGDTLTAFLVKNRFIKE